MREKEREEEGGILTVPDDDSRVRCQVCGAWPETPERVLCAACGEPMLRWGWAP